MMRFFKNTVGFGTARSIVKLFSGPYDTAVAGEEDDVTVTAAPPPLTLIIPTGTGISSLGKALATIRNISTGGQQIRVGVAPSFVTPSGMLLLPGEAHTFAGINIAISAVGNAAGGVINRQILWTSS